LILDYTAFSLGTFIDENVDPDATVANDSWSNYPAAVDDQCHVQVNLSKAADQQDRLYGVHLVASLDKRLIRGTFQGRFYPKYLQNILDEFVFRFNRRKSKYIGKKFMRIVQQVVGSAKIKWDLDPISEYFSLELYA
jgi:hypothetical protein